uniref:Uncharacterized protein n=1 Tax=Laticauda laticaudata TaxID=8630 RepID=A0A8C5SK91_LATLA
MQFRKINCVILLFTQCFSLINTRGKFKLFSLSPVDLPTDSLSCLYSTRMLSWLFICTFLGITSMHDISAQTCLCAQGLCASGWVQYKSACYKAVRQQYTWTEAEVSDGDTVVEQTLGARTFATKPMRCFPPPPLHMNCLL